MYNFTIYYITYNRPVLLQRYYLHLSIDFYDN